MRTVRPDFYDRFACKAGRCAHTCCAGWEIDIDDDTAKFYRGLSGELSKELADAVRTDEEGSHFVLSEDERCPFLQKDGLCRIIKTLGEDGLCDICALHPRFFGEAGDIALCGLGLSCERVCELLLETGEPLAFILEPEAGAEDGRDAQEAERKISIEALLDTCFREKTGGAQGGFPGEGLRFDPPRELSLSCEKIRRLIDTYAATEPIDEEWTRRLGELSARAEEVRRSAAEYLKTFDAGRYRRIRDYILFRQLESLRSFGAEAVLTFVKDAVRFIFLNDALQRDTAEVLRRWSEQIEYSTENVGILMRAESGNGEREDDASD